MRYTQPGIQEAMAGMGQRSGDRVPLIRITRNHDRLFYHELERLLVARHSAARFICVSDYHDHPPIPAPGSTL